ncbi:transcription factor [Apophysomyces ossiformis]|uniref:Transcription factor n=1 Tax=Apophysomyces ossiformis TaxID=679940 RepID=A0A8H7BXA0_9FUNG|nr:transcription factor [Apophysomyces ossiformis]
MGSPRQASFSVSELHKGLHLLTESRVPEQKVEIKVHAPPVPPEDSHRYPRLAGSNWTCYITKDSVILGRSPTGQIRPHDSHREADVDFGPSKWISRRHAEIKYHPRRKRWEIRVNSNNGVKVNQKMIRKGNAPVGLSTGTLLELAGVRFLFILPDTHVQPPQKQSQSADTPSDTTFSDLGTPGADFDLDGKLEEIILQILTKQGRDMNTREIVDAVMKNEKWRDQYTKESLLHALVMSDRFQVVESSLNLPPAQSDCVQWTLKPRAVSRPSRQASFADDFDYSIDGEGEDNDSSQRQVYTSSVRSRSYDEQEGEGGEKQEGQDAKLPWTGNLISMGMSIESIYSLWLAMERREDNDSLSKRSLDVWSLDSDPSSKRTRLMDNSQD